MCDGGRYKIRTCDPIRVKEDVYKRQAEQITRADEARDVHVAAEVLVFNRADIDDACIFCFMNMLPKESRSTPVSYTHLFPRPIGNACTAIRLNESKTFARGE